MLFKTRLCTLSFVALLSLLPVALAQDGNAGHGMAMGDGPLAGLMGEEFDVAFMSMMIAHHQGAIEMAEWLLDRSQDPDLQAAAEAVVAAQDPEIELMTAWLREWYGRDIDPATSETMQMEMASMMESMEAGADPDTAFLQQMTAHHMSAIDMAQLAMVQATRPELRTLARDVIVTQAEEVYQYQEWLAEDSSHSGH